MVKTQLRIIYGDTDQMGVVYYGNYLRFFEAARNEWLRAKGVRWRDIESEHDIYLPVAEAKVNYKRPAYYDDVIEIETRLGELGHASLRFDYRILRGADLLLRREPAYLGGELRREPIEIGDDTGGVLAGHGYRGRPGADGAENRRAARVRRPAPSR